MFRSFKGVSRLLINKKCVFIFGKYLFFPHLKNQQGVKKKNGHVISPTLPHSLLAKNKDLLIINFDHAYVNASNHRVCVYFEKKSFFSFPLFLALH